MLLYLLSKNGKWRPPGGGDRRCGRGGGDCIPKFSPIWEGLIWREGRRNINSRTNFILCAIMKLYPHFWCKIYWQLSFILAYTKTTFGSFLHHCKNITLDNKIKGVLLIGELLQIKFLEILLRGLSRYLVSRYRYPMSWERGDATMASSYCRTTA